MSTKLQTHKYKCKCKLVTYTQALESVADLKQIALLVITFPCRCRGVGRPRRERVDAHFRHRFLCCPCRCRGLGRPRRERVDAQFHCCWLSLLRVMLFSCLGGHPSMPIRFRTLSWELAEIMLLPLPVSGCGSSPAGEGGRPFSSSLSLLPLPVSGLGSSPAGEGGRPIS